MTNEELATAIQQGNADLLHQLYEQTIKFANLEADRAAAHYPDSAGITAEDFRQCAWPALVSAVELFDAERGGFLTAFSWCLKREYRRAAGYSTTKRDAISVAISLDVPLTNDEGDPFTRSEILPSEAAQMAFTAAEDAIYTEQLHDVLEQQISTLPAEDAELIRAKYWRGASFSEIATDTGQTAPAVYHRHDAALRRLRHGKAGMTLQEFVDENTAFYRGFGVSAFQRDGSRTTEQIALRRLSCAERFQQWQRENGLL